MPASVRPWLCILTGAAAIVRSPAKTGTPTPPASTARRPAGRGLGQGLELVDAAGKQQIVQRNDIKRMVSQPISIMPEGFDQLPPEDLTNLVEFLAQPVLPTK